MQQHVDTAAIRRDFPIADVVARYGIDLRPNGRSLVGRCPFHADGGRPNLHIYPATCSFYCYRCAIGGDVISFVERIEGVGFRRAVERLTGQPTVASITRSQPARRRVPIRAPTFPGADERACLAAAVELYQSQLHNHPAALDYLAGRGLDQPTLEQCRVGYARGNALIPYLRWRRLPLAAALRVGLLRPDGGEYFARRIVVPEIRRGQPIWLIGRMIDPVDEEPRYLSLPGAKPLLGWDAARTRRAVCVVEGVFDWLALRCWGIPAIALAGIHANRRTLRTLARFDRVYLVFDTDEAGQRSTRLIAQTLGPRAIPVTLPGAKDVAELAARPGGKLAFAAALRAVTPDSATPSPLIDSDAPIAHANSDPALPVPAEHWPALLSDVHMKEASDGL
jgi:DNA primase